MGKVFQFQTREQLEFAKWWRAKLQSGCLSTPSEWAAAGVSFPPGAFSDTGLPSASGLCAETASGDVTDVTIPIEGEVLPEPPVEPPAVEARRAGVPPPGLPTRMGVRAPRGPVVSPTFDADWARPADRSEQVPPSLEPTPR